MAGVLGVYVSSLEKSKRSSSGRGILIRNISSLGAEKVLRMGGSLLVGTLVVRYLGPTRFGIYSYAYAIFALFNTLSNCGLDYLVVKDIALAKDVEDEVQVLGTAFMLKVVASVATTLMAICYASLLPSASRVVVSIVAMLSFAGISQGFDVVDFYYQAKTRSHITVMAQVVVFLVISGLRVSAVVLKAPLIVFGVIGACEILFSEAGLALVYHWQHKNIARWRFNRSAAKELMQASWPLMISSLLVMIYMRTDQLLLGMMATPAAVGQYSAAVKLSELWYTIPTIICTSVMPRLLSGREANPEGYLQKLQRLYGLMALISVAIALGVTFLGKYAILLLFGKQYMMAATILSVHIWTGPFVFIGVVGSMQMVHERLTRFSMVRSAIGAVLNVVFNLLLIPHFGGVGSAFATLLAQAGSSYVADALNRETRHIFYMKTRAFLGLFQWKALRSLQS